MKRFLALVAVLAATALCLPAQAESPKDSTATPEESIRSFYRWYVTALLANRDPMEQRAEMKRFATDRLLKEIDKMKKGPDGLNGDYFVDGQDFDEQWAKKILVSNVKIEGARATAHVLLDGPEGMRKKLVVQLVNDAGRWKIDKVQGRDGGD
ncbi:MAG TPA: DUF3828 domain-containing protein [Chthoniobacterales bacterium]|nr:DUF3828 domain-containing protein [Chthoniobacterales bacterium]